MISCTRSLFEMFCLWLSSRFSKNDFVVCVGFSIVPNCHIAMTQHNCFYSNSLFSETTRSTPKLTEITHNYSNHFSWSVWPRLQPVLLYFLTCIGLKSIDSFLALEIWRTRSAKIFRILGSTWFLYLMFFQQNWLEFVLQVINLELPTFVGIISYKSLVLSLQANHNQPQLSGSVFSLEKSRHSNSFFFSSTCFVFPQTCQPIASCFKFFIFIYLDE